MNTQTESEQQRELTIFQQSDTNISQGSTRPSALLKSAHELKISIAHGEAEGSSCKQRLETDERKISDVNKPKFIMEVEEYSVLTCIPSWSNPRQLCLFGEGVRQDLGLLVNLKHPLLIRRDVVTPMKERIVCMSYL
jgi:hypothetical protein